MIGEILKELRIKKGIPAAALDEYFGIQRGSWMNWENGFSTPEPELLEEIAEYFGVNRKELQGEQDSVSLLGFGTFSVKERAAREGRNPRTGEVVKIAAAKTPAFKPGKALKDKVNG